MIPTAVAGQTGTGGRTSPPAGKTRTLGDPTKAWSLEIHQARDTRERRTFARQAGKASPSSPSNAHLGQLPRLVHDHPSASTRRVHRGCYVDLQQRRTRPQSGPTVRAASARRTPSDGYLERLMPRSTETRSTTGWPPQRVTTRDMGSSLGAGSHYSWRDSYTPIEGENYAYH